MHGEHDTIKIFIGNLRENTNKNRLRAAFEQFGTVVECVVINKYGFVHMADDEEADAAIQALDGELLDGRRMQVALSKDESSDSNVDTKKDTIKIFVGNVRENASKNKLRAAFERFGTVVECALLDRYGFVHMTNEEEANAAIAAMNDSEFEGSNLRVERASQGRSNGRGGRDAAKHGDDKRDTIKIFIGNLRENANANKLRAAFEEFGTVVECVVLDKYGFVHMTNEEEAKAAIAAMNKSEFEGTHLRVQRSSHGRDGGLLRDDHKDTIKIFVGNLRENANGIRLQALFEQFGTVVECTVIDRYGFVHMTNEEEADAAIADLHHSEFEGTNIRVQRSSRGRDDEEPTTKIFVGNLPHKSDPTVLQQMFEQYGKVVSCDILSKFGFVHMADPEEAKAAIYDLDGQMLGGRYIQVSLSKDDTSMKPPVKIFVGNLRLGSNPDLLRKKFAKFGRVTECAVVKKYGFVHMANEKQAQVAISTLHRTDFEGNRINVQMARSDPQMGDDDHYGPDCYDEGNGYGDSYGSYGRGRRESRSSRYDPYARPPPPHDQYGRQPHRDPYDDLFYNQDPYSRCPVDPYDRYPLPVCDPYDRPQWPARDRYPPRPNNQGPYSRFDKDAYVRYPPPAKGRYDRYPPRGAGRAPVAAAKDRTSTTPPSTTSGEVDPGAAAEMS